MALISGVLQRNAARAISSAFEHPQVFPAAAAPGYDNFVYPTAFIQLSDSICDLLRRLKALHIDRAEQEFRRRPAPTNDIANVLQCRTGLAGDDADAFGIRGQRLFVLYRKKSLLLEFGFQLLKASCAAPMPSGNISLT